MLKLMTDSHVTSSVYFFYNYDSRLTRFCHSKSWSNLILLMALSINFMIVSPKLGKFSSSRRQSSSKRSLTSWRAFRLMRSNWSLDNGCPSILVTIIFLKKPQASSSFFDKCSSTRMKSSILKCSVFNFVFL